MKQLSLIVILFFPLIINSQTITINGRVSDESGNSLPFVNIYTADGKYTSSSDFEGEYSIFFPVTYKTLHFKPADSDEKIIRIPETDLKEIILNIEINTSNNIDAVIIEAEKINSTGIISVDTKIADVLPSITGGIESLIKTELGVTASRNELSSKYSVRGGSFDENLVYVNGIEIYRPQLIRSGQQEGLSFIDPKLVSEAKFSAGGFEARYGGKLSSVLDIVYKQAKEEEVSGSISLLGATAHYQNISKNKKFSYIGSVRYKTTRYLLNSLETKGFYNPRFIDFQTYLSYTLNTNLSINILANISDNNFRFIPESGTTNFGSIQSLKSLTVNFTGQENDRFFSHTEAISFDVHPHKNLNFTLNFSGFQAFETETFDIIAFYNLNELNKDISSENAGDSLLNLGNGAYMRHARNYLSVIGINSSLSGYYKTGKNYFNWGLTHKYEQINDNIDEWVLEDSASYSIPVNPVELSLSENIKASNSITSNKYIAYFQDKINFSSYYYHYEVVTGLRGDYSDYSDELLFSPRLALAIKSNNKNKHVFRFSTGIYNQAAFYKEIRDFDGNLSTNSSAQKSVHYVLGHNFKFKALGRNMHLYTELYFKNLKNIIPFEMDNVRVRYYADVRTSGYTGGIDIKLMGDFVPGIDSWLSLSLLKTEELIQINSEIEAYKARPTDQRFSANLFIQDYIPGNKYIKAHMNLIYGSAFPFGFPKDIVNKAISRSAPYHRVDLGASVVLIEDRNKLQSQFFKRFKSLWLTVEVFNMLDIENTISYRWIHVVPNTSIAANDVKNNYPIPVNLTGRRFNLKLTLTL
jgi:hypothetical protein